MSAKITECLLNLKVRMRANAVRHYQVESTEELLVFSVRRINGAKTHRVDLVANDGAGHCSCEDFEYRRYPAWRENPSLPELAICKHIGAARHAMVTALLKRIAEDENHATKTE